MIWEMGEEGRELGDGRSHGGEMGSKGGVGGRAEARVTGGAGDECELVTEARRRARDLPPPCPGQPSRGGGGGHAPSSTRSGEGADGTAGGAERRRGRRVRRECQGRVGGGSDDGAAVGSGRAGPSGGADLSTERQPGRRSANDGANDKAAGTERAGSGRAGPSGDAAPASREPVRALGEGE